MRPVPGNGMPINLLGRLAWIWLVLFCSLAVHSGDANLYRDRHNGFSIRYPEGWTVQGHPFSRNLIRADLVSADGKTGLQVRIYPSEFRAFSGFVAWYTEQFLREMPNTSLLDERYRSSGDFPVCTITFDGRRRNGYFLKSYLIWTGKRIFVLQGGTPYARKSRDEPLLDSIAASFSAAP